MDWQGLRTVLGKLERSFSKVGGIFGLFLAFVAILPASGVALLILQSVEKENRANIQETIGETLQMAADHFQSEMAHFKSHLYWVAKNQLGPIALSASQQTDAPGSKRETVVGKIDTQPEILDVSLWKRGTSNSAFELEAMPQRIALGLNESSPKVALLGDSGRKADEILGRIQAAEESEIPVVQAALHGKIVVILATSVFGGQAGILLAIPLEDGLAPERVAVAHLSGDRFLKSLEIHGMASLALVDSFGNSLPEGFFRGDSHTVNPKSLYRLSQTTQLANGQSLFKSENGEWYFGGYSKITLGHLSVLATLSAAESGSVLSVLRHETAIVLVFSFLLFLGIGYQIPTQSRKSEQPEHESKQPEQPDQTHQASAEAPSEGPSDSAGEISIDPVEKKNRWLVNNGSQIIGPFAPEEIAKMLFTQELDFDCECWSEGTGNSSQIRNIGIFEGSEDPEASLWFYDGVTIHGPMSPGFLKTAIGHGAIHPEEVLICEASTVNGWKKLEAWNPDFFTSLKARDQLKKAV